jgi:CubicO group peptidase (beta-lactamase class C family)
MMRTNHVNPDPLKTMPAGTGWGMDFQVVTDAAAAGESVSNGTFSWWGIAGTWFWIDPVKDLAFVGMVQHANIGTSRGIHALSRSLVNQAVLDYAIRCGNYRSSIALNTGEISQSHNMAWLNAQGLVRRSAWPGLSYGGMQQHGKL